MERQQDRDIAIPERPQGARPENPPDVRRQTLVRMNSDARLGAGSGFDGAE